MKPVPLMLIMIAVGAVCYSFGEAVTKQRFAKSSPIEQRPMPWHHLCKDTTHQVCWEKCKCEGEECFVWKRSYQVHAIDDTVVVYLGDRMLGIVRNSLGHQIDTLLKYPK